MLGSVVFTLACCEWDWGGGRDGEWLDVCAQTTWSTSCFIEDPFSKTVVSAVFTSVPFRPVPNTLETCLIMLWVVLSFQGVFDIISNSQTVVTEGRTVSTEDGLSYKKFTVLPSQECVGCGTFQWQQHPNSAVNPKCRGWWNHWENEHLCILIDRIRSSTEPLPNCKKSLSVLTFMRTSVSLKQLAPKIVGLKYTPTRHSLKNSSAQRYTVCTHLERACGLTLKLVNWARCILRS